MLMMLLKMALLIGECNLATRSSCTYHEPQLTIQYFSPLIKEGGKEERVALFILENLEIKIDEKNSLISFLSN